MIKTSFAFLILLFFHSIYAQEKLKTIDEVVILKEKRAITNKGGNIKIDVANSVFKSVATPIDLLAKIPTVQMSANKESVSIIGKGVPLLYIDNQRVELNDLSSLSMEEVKSVEIINNPSPKYEANGRVVILIVKKLSKRDGYKVTVSETASFQRKFNNYFGVNASVKKGKIEWKANVNYNQLALWEKNGNDFTIPEQEIVSNYSVLAITYRPQFVFGGGVFCKINDNDYISVSINNRSQNDNFDISTATFNQEASLINTVQTLNANQETRNFTNVFLNYNHKIQKINGQLFLGFQYSKYNRHIASEISNNYNNTNFNKSQNRDQKIAIDVLSARADFEKEFANKMKLESGFLYLNAKPQTEFALNILDNNVKHFSKYIYNETNVAGYCTIKANYKKLNYSFGFRAENTNAKGIIDGAPNRLVDKDYMNFFPKAEIGFAMDSTKTLTFDYAKSIVRPNFSTTSQLSTYINPYFVWNSNINVSPSLIDTYTLGYQWKDKTVKLNYTDIKNPVYYAVNYNEMDKLLVFQTDNFQKESGYSIEFTLPFEYKFWTTTNVVSANVNKVEDKLSVVNSSKPYLYLYSNHIFKLPKNTELSLTAWGLSKRNEGVFDRNALGTFDISVSKIFFKDWDCTLSFNDVFRQVKYDENFTNNKITSKGVYYTDLHLVSFAIKYSFGKIKKIEFKGKEVNETMSRIK